MRYQFILLNQVRVKIFKVLKFKNHILSKTSTSEQLIIMNIKFCIMVSAVNLTFFINTDPHPSFFGIFEKYFSFLFSLLQAHGLGPTEKETSKT